MYEVCHSAYEEHTTDLSMLKARSIFWPTPAVFCSVVV